MSGLIVPIIVIINSLKYFTYYKFHNNNNNNNNNIRGKFLLLITVIVLITLSTLISRYIFINFKIFLDFFIGSNEYLVQYDIDKQILFVMILSIFLIFKKTKIVIKKIILTNFFLFSLITWYSQINNSFFIDIVPPYIFKFENINFINITFLLAIETVFYLWSYISYGSYLSDWNLPTPGQNYISPIINIVMIYLPIFLYYSILFK